MLLLLPTVVPLSPPGGDISSVLFCQSPVPLSDPIGSLHAASLQLLQDPFLLAANCYFIFPSLPETPAPYQNRTIKPSISLRSRQP